MISLWDVSLKLSSDNICCCCFCWLNLCFMISTLLFGTWALKLSPTYFGQIGLGIPSVFLFFLKLKVKNDNLIFSLLPGWARDYFVTFLNRRLTENYSSWGTNINFNCNMTESSIVELFGYIMWCSQWIDWSCRSVQYNSGNVPWMPWLNLSGTEWINSNLNV